MATYECIIAPVSTPSEESTVIIEALEKGAALIENFKQYPGTFVKEIREISGQNQT